MPAASHRTDDSSAAILHTFHRRRAAVQRRQGPGPCRLAGGECACDRTCARTEGRNVRPGHPGSERLEHECGGWAGPYRLRARLRLEAAARRAADAGRAGQPAAVRGACPVTRLNTREKAAALV